MGYAWIRHQSASTRSSHGWQSEDGRSRISKARKGMSVVKDALTGEIIGSVSKDHENILSGKWVHHSKGKKLSKKEVERLKEDNKGQKNPNASGLDEEYFYKKGTDLSKEFGYIPFWREMIDLSSRRGFKWIKSCKSRFGGRGFAGYYEEIEKRTGLKYDSYRTRRIKKK